MFRLPGCFNVNSVLAFSILSLPIVNDKMTIKKSILTLSMFRLPGCFNVNGALGEDSAASRGRLQATAEYLR